MHRTTIKLDNKVFKKIQQMAEQENRTTPNLIETILMRYMDSDLFVDDFEMGEIKKDKDLNKSIRQGLADYKAGRGQFV